MKKYYEKLIALLLCCCFCAILIISANGERRLKAKDTDDSKVVLIEESSEELKHTKTETRTALVLYSPQSELSLKYEKNLQIALKHLRIQGKFLDIGRTESVSYEDYDMVILACEDMETQLKDSMVRLLDYVKGGGALFWGMVPDEMGTQFRSVYRKLGIVDCGDYLTYDNLHFQKELLPGINGMSFSGESFTDAGGAFQLEERAEIYATTEVDGEEFPVIWNYPLGKGNVTFYNGTGITGDFWRGIAAGCINTLSDETMYPVINALCLFIDDFPSPQYESTSNVVKDTYNRNVQEFYRDIWWPDMQKVADRYEDEYTGLFVATYNNIVDPDKFTYQEPSMEQYYGNSLLKNGYEMGAHGYNHQSLTLKGGTPADMKYKPWADTADMTASLTELRKIKDKLFPSVTFRTYVPPSNYLSKEGRQAVKQAYPELKVISGIYTNESEQGEVYAQDFEMAEDGIAEFPRITSGMMPGDYERMEIISAAGLYGTFSHFLHPDDIFDEERGDGQTWDVLYESYCEMMKLVHEKYPYMRSLTAADAADALKVSDEIVPYLKYTKDKIEGSCDHFYGEAYFYLRTEKTPKSADDSCRVEKIDPKHGEDYYIVTVTKPNFTIELV